MPKIIVSQNKICRLLANDAAAKAFSDIHLRSHVDENGNFEKAYIEMVEEFEESFTEVTNQFIFERINSF